MRIERERAAEEAAKTLEDYFMITGRPIGLILGTGWGDTLNFGDEFPEIPFFQIPGFKSLASIEGHRRSVVAGEIAGKPVLALNGRIHLNEKPFSKNLAKMVRLQSEMLFKFGVQKIIVTSAVGALKCSPTRFHDSTEKEMKAGNFNFPDPQLRVGEIAIVDGFISLYAPEMPLWAGEFCSPDRAISPRLMEIALEAQNSNIVAKKTGLAMVRGPQFEGRYDKAILSNNGAGVVGMSMYPEACIAAMHGIEFLGLGFVTNDDEEIHSHETNLARAKASSEHLGEYLSKIIMNM